MRSNRFAAVGERLLEAGIAPRHARRAVIELTDHFDDLAAELGLLTTRIVRHVQALPHISRAHVYRVGDGAAHLHVWFFARPEGQAQLFGSWLPVWDDLLPEYPADVAEADAAIVADALVASHGGRRSAVTPPRD